ncbi:MAG: TatD family deoxyribonuclease [Candidatus Hydrogenedentota bacterium]|nr:MAG: TatD family deoxyribonuclease [Candidatus Hydrogenedentota bacterium]
MDMEEFEPDRQAVLERSLEAGVVGWIVPGTTLEGTRRALTASWRREGIFFGAGIHPHEVETTEWDEVLFRELLEHPEVVAVGETGLDYYYGAETRRKQIVSLEHHAALAAETGVPLILHSRNGKDGNVSAFAEIFAVLAGISDVVLHSFTGTRAEAEKALERGWYLGMGGIATFPRSAELREVFGSIPLERILLETDAPYLAPVPYRGKRNEPAYLVETGSLLARLQERSIGEAAAETSRNADTLFFRKQRRRE